MKVLLIFVASLMLASCGSKKAGNSNGGSNGGGSGGGGSSPTVPLPTLPLPTVPLPTVTIATGLADITAANAANFMLSGTCSEEGQSVTVSVEDLSPETAPACTNGSWMAEIDLSSLTGSSRDVSITADHASSGGQNATQATGSVIAYLSFSMDTLVDITDANAGSFTVSGSCLEEGEPIEVNVGSVSPGTNPDCTNGAWTITMDVTGVNKTSGDISVTADHSPATGSAHSQQTQTVTNNFTCPTNYVGVPALASYTTNSFCVMKYEVKNDSGVAVSEAAGTPYVSIDRANSITKCTALGDGYDLITNDEWQSIARNIELVGGNWATGVVGNAGGLSRGHSDGTPTSILAANSDDTKGCEGTEQTCSNTVWNSQRRTHTLSNGEVIWDIAGNVWEWVKDNNDSQYNTAAYFSRVTATSHPASNSLSGGTTTTSRNAKAQFGPSGDYTTLSTSPWGNLGYGVLNFSAGGVFRGNNRNGGLNAGVFAVNLNFTPVLTSTSIGFRCVLHP